MTILPKRFKPQGRQALMKAYGTYFQNDPVHPLMYGEVDLINPPRQRLRGERLKEGIPVQPVIVGFCGTDHELMMMGKRGQLGPKFPAGQQRPWRPHKALSRLHL